VNQVLRQKIDPPLNSLTRSKNEPSQEGTFNPSHQKIFTSHYNKIDSDMPQKNVTDRKSPFAFTLRRSRVLFVLVMLFASLAVVWPGQALFSSATPLVLGFPLSFAWIIFWVVVCFVSMMSLYLFDSKHEETD
jgi:hypothetical protein